MRAILPIRRVLGLSGHSAGVVGRHGLLVLKLDSIYLFLDVLKDLVVFDRGQDLFTGITSSRSLDLLCEQGKLLYGVSNFLGEPQNQGPDDDEKEDAASDDDQH